MRAVRLIPVIILAVLFCSCGQSAVSHRVPNHVIFHPENAGDRGTGLVFIGDTLLACRIDKSDVYPDRYNVWVRRNNSLTYDSRNVFFVRGRKIIEAKRTIGNRFFSGLIDGVHVANIKVLDNGNFSIEQSIPMDKAKEIDDKCDDKIREARKKGEKYELTYKERQANAILYDFKHYLEECTYIRQDTAAPAMRFRISPEDDEIFVEVEERIDYSGTYCIIDEISDANFVIKKDNSWTASGIMGFRGNFCNIEFSGYLNKEGQMIVDKGTYEDIETGEKNTLPQGYVFGTCKGSKIEYRDGEMVDYIHKCQI